MKKVIRITESDLTRIVKRVLNENAIDYPFPNRKTISIINNEGKNVDVDCELAQTPEEKKQGLLYRDGIEDNCGVLFNSDKDSAYHMVDMDFPIEMIFINGGQIVEIIKAQPEQKNIVPANSFAMNLEVKDGYCDENNISVGNNVLLLGDVIKEDEDRVKTKKEKYIEVMTELAKSGQTWRTLGLTDEQIQFFNNEVLKQVIDFMKSKERFNSNDYLDVSTGSYENVQFDFDYRGNQKDEGDTYQNNTVVIYVDIEVYDGNVDLLTADELGLETFDTYDVVDVLNGSLDDMGQSDVSWEVGYEVKEIIEDIIIHNVPLIKLSQLVFDINLRS
ncbi:DUF192 domain-containing protein [bacterium]|nr:DUF192 domain-containing protein [bacterium]